MAQKQKIKVEVIVSYEEFEKDYLKNVNPVATKKQMRDNYCRMKRNRK